MPIVPFDIHGVITHEMQADRMNVLGGDSVDNLERVRWSAMLLRAEFATSGTGARFTQEPIGIATFTPIIPQHTHDSMIVTLNLHRIV
jgi:hypothetical protein